MKKTVTLADRVFAVLQGGDKSKLVRFESKLGKYFTKQKAMRQEQISNLQDKIADAYDTAKETVEFVEVDKIKDTDGADAYCATYVGLVLNKLNAIDALQEKIDALEAEISKFEEIESFIYSAEEGL